MVHVEWGQEEGEEEVEMQAAEGDGMSGLERRRRRLR